jgi:hypothetical protein
MTNAYDAATAIDAINSFAPVVESAKQAIGLGLPLPSTVLSALLETPSKTSSGTEPNDSTTLFEQVDLVWSSIEPVLVPISVCPGETILHEVSQSFVRRLKHGRYRCYRLHRFILPDLECWSDLIKSALKHEQSAEEKSLLISNVGGFHSAQDLFASGRYVGADDLSRCIAACVQRTAVVDAAEVLAAGDTPLPSPFSNESAVDGWANVSRQGALNVLHTHADIALATVFFAQVPPGGGGSTMLRFTPGPGQGCSEPDEERHVPRMSAAPDGCEVCRTWPRMCAERHLCRECGATVADTHMHGPVRFAEVPPIQRSLLVIPGWLSHSVAPHFSEKPRISIASNWQLPCAEEDPFAEERLRHST